MYIIQHYLSSVCGLHRGSILTWEHATSMNWLQYRQQPDDNMRNSVALPGTGWRGKGVVCQLSGQGPATGQLWTREEELYCNPPSHPLHHHWITTHNQIRDYGAVSKQPIIPKSDSMVQNQSLLTTAYTVWILIVS